MQSLVSERVFNIVEPGENEVVPTLEYRSIHGYEMTQIRFIPLSENDDQ